MRCNYCGSNITLIKYDKNRHRGIKTIKHKPGCINNNKHSLENRLMEGCQDG